MHDELFTKCMETLDTRDVEVVIYDSDWSTNFALLLVKAAIF